MDENKVLAEDMDKFPDVYRGKAYQQLVTDKDGKAQWEDQLAYDSRIEISWDGDTTGRVSFTDPQMHSIYYKISDLTPGKEEIIGGTIKFSSNHDPIVIIQEDIYDFGEEAYTTGPRGEIFVSFVDNIEVQDAIIIPERGTYVCYDEVTGYAKSLTYGKIKQLDEKFLPILPNLNVIFTCHNFNESGVTPQYRCNVTYSQLRDWYDRGLPIFAICKVIRYEEIYETLIMSSYEFNNSKSIMVFSGSGQKSGALRLAYHENGGVTKYEEEPS